MSECASEILAADSTSKKTAHFLKYESIPFRVQKNIGDCVGRQGESNPLSFGWTLSLSKECSGLFP